MKQGFVKVAAVTPNMRVADVEYNVNEICRMIDETTEQGAKVIAFPELCITGYTCGDLFSQEILLREAKQGLYRIAEYTKEKDALIFVGVPYEVAGKLYNTTAALNHGKVLGLVTKTFLPNYGEFYEMRQFQAGPQSVQMIETEGHRIPFGPRLLFQAETMKHLIVSAEICEDVWSAVPPSIEAAVEGATLIVNCSASNEIAGKEEYRRSLIAGQSARLLAGYVYANAGEGESTQDLVFGGQNMIAENGVILAEGKRFHNGIVCSEIDVQRLNDERRRLTTYQPADDSDHIKVCFHLNVEETKLTRKYSQYPFVPSRKEERDMRCDEILNIQAMGLKKRMDHIHCHKATVGLSGGLDSTLALLVIARAFDLSGADRKDIHCITMPCFGTTDRTYQNACKLSQCLGAALSEINIKEAVNVHFRDIAHDPSVHDVTYENSQARERTQILMDSANQDGSILVGTGDLSELALGWATYNGDHMSMYGVNASVPKTLVRHLVRYYADTCKDEKLTEVLLDILDTPVSPELLPPKDGKIAQKTEDLVGPYELHDFYLYYVLRFGYEPSKIYRLAKYAFGGIYEDEIILKWLKKFYWRFFSQQFKRSCLPDGPKTGTVSLSPRGDWRMPSDACVTLWQKDLDALE